jgi:hypothetical protein
MDEKSVSERAVQQFRPGSPCERSAVPDDESEGLGAITDFAAYINAAIERLNKLASYFPESKDQLAEVAVRIKAERDRTMKFLLAETLTSVKGKVGGSGEEPPRWGTGGF